MNKNTNVKKYLQQWEKATNELTNYFIRKYYGEIPMDSYWVADEIGGILFVNDNFYDLNDMVNFLKYNYTKEEMFKYYDERVTSQCAGTESCPSIKNWKSLRGK